MDDAIFEKIYEETSRPLWAYIARVSGSPTAADDIVQETYLRFLRSPPRSYEMTDVKPYLYKIATNLVYDRFRKMKFESPEEIDTERMNKGLPAIDNGSEMMQIFAKLKQQERSLLWLAYVEGYDHREIAEVLKMNKMSVRVLLFRAKRKLAQFLESTSAHSA